MPKYPASNDAAEPCASHSTPELNRTGWDRAAVRLLAKMLGEFAYEEVIEPAAVGKGDKSGDTYSLPLDDGATLRFRARRGVYGSWRVEAGSITEITAGSTTAIDADTTGNNAGSATANAGSATAINAAHRAQDDAGSPAEAAGNPRSVPRPFRDPLQFLARAHRLLGIDGATLGHLIREVTTTLAADARLDHNAVSAARLAELDYAELEGHQTGHPWLVANKGRLGFSAEDMACFAPEARRAVRLPWIAVSTRIAGYRGVPRLATPEQLYAQELDPSVRRSFDAALRARGLDPREYLFLPVHPWQWDEWIVPHFAPAIADGDIVRLHPDGDLRLPQQSIRTFTNVARKDRHTVKLPLSILNTLVWRGLPTERTLAAPAVTAWVQGRCESDPFLRDTCGVILLGEVASVAVEHPLYDLLPETPYQFKEILGAIWREPLHTRLAAGERARTLASLLHTDPEGRAFVAELVTRSGLAPTVWLTRLFGALLPPLLHFLYRYGTVFSPHGENAIVVFDDQDVPVRLAIKDFVDDVNISARPLPEHDSMPDAVRRILLTESPTFLTQFIHSGLFVGVFRYLSPLCEEQLGVPEDEFWSLVRAEIVRHHARFPELKDRFEMFDMLTPRIERLCLNRNRLHVDGYRDRSQRPHAAVHGTVPNPLHPLGRVGG
ncbi:IucA/IucC family siderophore biosynthesis protein [Streptomyces finlayi]|uniref:IucA/IucC family siderophore biosynthesis protein n=1 Tax=Streptomyces finlayi TaxID=67296 RepID=A0A7G7BGE7_9ACTN|nr:IucA/IucC family siderophore biosynthesis protein [Streptomyces finlayi]QNE74412.1 IucA/IucC family siderophore biosynthesis protein [Streptomyces finlayi]